jgi:hypothetical protein
LSCSGRAPNVYFGVALQAKSVQSKNFVQEKVREKTERNSIQIMYNTDTEDIDNYNH